MITCLIQFELVCLCVQFAQKMGINTSNFEAIRKETVLTEITYMPHCIPGVRKELIKCYRLEFPVESSLEFCVWIYG